MEAVIYHIQPFYLFDGISKNEGFFTQIQFLKTEQEKKSEEIFFSFKKGNQFSYGSI